MKPLFILILLALVCGLGSGQVAWATALPSNHLDLEDRYVRTSAFDIEELEFKLVIDSVTSHYQDVVAAHGAKLVVKADWADSTVNAFATQEGTDWTVNFFGGLARRPEVTRDAFALVVCHELGHHLGGFPFYTDEHGWAASEGESDYFATHSCARAVWKEQLTENAKFRPTAPEFVRQKCDSVWVTTADQNLCYRTAAASQALYRLMAVLQNVSPPQFDAPDPSEVSETDLGHPMAQCRLDTTFAGSLCRKPFKESVIPGRNHPKGQESLAAEKLAGRYSCMEAGGFTLGVRPHCWFKPHWIKQAAY